MNVFSRSIILMLLLGGTARPVEWKYIFPWTVAAVCFGGCIGFKILSMQDKSKINELVDDNTEKNKEIKRLQTGTGSIPRKKSSQKKSILESASTEETNQNKELMASLKKDVETKSRKIQELEEKLEGREELYNNLYNNYSPLISAVELASPQEYVLDVVQLNTNVSLSVKIGGEIFELIAQSKFYIPGNLSVNASVAMWQAQRGDTIKINNKGRASKIRQAPPQLDTGIPVLPVTSTMLTSELPNKNLDQQKKDNRLSKATIDKTLAELSQYSETDN